MLVNSNGVIKTTSKPWEVNVQNHRIEFAIPWYMMPYHLPWNGTTIFPLNLYDFEYEKPVVGAFRISLQLLVSKYYPRFENLTYAIANYYIEQSVSNYT